MLNRRLWILFIGFLLVFALLAARLSRLQLVQANTHRANLRQLLHRNVEIDSYRGPIVDRNGLVLAQDVPSDELAIDYRALSQDYSWLRKNAIERLKKAGAWEGIDAPTRDARIAEGMDDLLDQIAAMPDAIARQLAPAIGRTVDDVREDLLGRIEKIRARIETLRQNQWVQRYERKSRPQASSSGESASDVDDSALDALFRRIQVEDEVASHTLWPDLPRDVAVYVKQHAGDFPGLSVRDNAEHNRREYPFGEATAQLVGTLRSVSDKALAAHKFIMPDLMADKAGDLSGYLADDRMGESGIEKTAEDSLRGTRGVRLLDLTGGKSATDIQRIAPVPGHEVKLTIDAALQQDIYNALRNPADSLSKNLRGNDGKSLLLGEDGKEHFAAMVVMALNGEVLALISYPSYDPDTIDTLRVEAVREQRKGFGPLVWRTPLVNRATSAIYHPGSTVKPLLASAVLTEKLVTREETIDCKGHFFESRPDIFRCDGTHGPISLVDAIKESCDVYFYTMGQRMGMERLVPWYGNYGFGHETGLELPEANGNLPVPDRVGPSLVFKLDERSRAFIDPEEVKRDALFMGIGQGPMDVTPIQMANAYATLLRRGAMVPPRIVAGTPITHKQPMTLSAETLATIKEGMEGVTTGAHGESRFHGTAESIFKTFKLHVAGKTGTAETERVVFDDQGNPVYTPDPLIYDGKPQFNDDGTPKYKQLVERHDDAWFVGYAPADNPRYIVAAVMEWGGHGGAHAAPMVREAFMQLEQHNYLPHTDVP